MLLKETNDMNDNNDMFSPQTQPTQSLNELELHVAQAQHMHQKPKLCILIIRRIEIIH